MKPIEHSPPMTALHLLLRLANGDRMLLSPVKLVASATCRNSPPAFASLCRASTPTVGSQSTDYNVKQFFLL